LSFYVDGGRFALSPNQFSHLTVMPIGKLSIFELYMPYSGDTFIDISQNLGFFLKKREILMK
jgi:hypothetical protein